jgi:UDP-N-acetylmuramate--alanine ligase
MNSLAQLLCYLGYTVSGCDLQPPSMLCENLTARGCILYTGHEVNHLKGVSVLVYPTGIPHDNEELRTARAHGIATVSRTELLSHLLRNNDIIAVMGSGGSTVTTALLGHLLRSLAIDPTIVVDGEWGKRKRSVHMGSSKWAVVDGGGSRNALRFLRPVIAILTRINEATPIAADEAPLLSQYDSFLSAMPFYGTILLNADEHNLQPLHDRYRGKVITYGVKKRGQLFVEDITLCEEKSYFNVVDKKEGLLGTIHLNLPGLHNVSSALAAIALCYRVLQLPFDLIQKAISRFYGLARHQEVVGTFHGATVIDDCANDARTISAALATARSRSKKNVHVVWQPNGYHLLQEQWEALLNLFAKHHKKIASLHVLPVKAGMYERPIETISSDLFAQQLSQTTPELKSFCYSEDELLSDGLQSLVQGGDTVLTVGATPIEILV